jgi:hypothetical protein
MQQLEPELRTMKKCTRSECEALDRWHEHEEEEEKADEAGEAGQADGPDGADEE